MFEKAEIPAHYKESKLLESVAQPKAVEQGKRSSAAGESGKRGDRWNQLNTFVDDDLRFIKNATYKLVWIVLFRHAKPDGTARICQQRIADQMDVSVRTVGRAIKELDSAGCLSILHQGGLNRGPSKIRLHSPTRQY